MEFSEIFIVCFQFCLILIKGFDSNGMVVLKYWMFCQQQFLVKKKNLGCRLKILFEIRLFYLGEGNMKQGIELYREEQDILV